MTRPPILFLPGMMCDSRVFSPQITFLNEISWPYACVEFFRADTIPKMAEAGFKVVQDQGWNSFVVCGLSMGGIVAMEMMRSHQVTGAILIDTNHLADTPEKKEKRNRQNQEVEEDPKRFSQIVKDEMKPFYLEENTGERAGELWDIFYDMAMALGRRVFIQQNLALRDRDSYEDTIRNYKGACLILCGEADPLCPPERHRAIMELTSHGEIHILPRAGHIANLEKPEETNRIMGEWLNRQNWEKQS